MYPVIGTDRETHVFIPPRARATELSIFKNNYLQGLILGIHIRALPQADFTIFSLFLKENSERSIF